MVDFHEQVAYIATDHFGTKPLWLSTSDGLHIASYESALDRLGCKDIQQLPPNTVLAISTTTFLLLEQHPVFEFDMRQYKTSTADWETAFKTAIEKRVQYAQHGVFLGLSSGYDSGLIQLGLDLLGQTHFAYTIVGSENLQTISNRMVYSQNVAEGNIILLSEPSMQEEWNFLWNKTEPYWYKAKDGQQFAVASDYASSGLSYICRACRKRGILIYLSGTGTIIWCLQYCD